MRAAGKLLTMLLARVVVNFLALPFSPTRILFWFKIKTLELGSIFFCYWEVVWKSHSINIWFAMICMMKVLLKYPFVSLSMYFSTIYGNIWLKLTCCERFQKAKAEPALINWMNTFTYMIFNEMPACVINTALFWINTTKEGYNFNLTPSTLWQLWHKMFYYIFFWLLYS